MQSSMEYHGSAPDQIQQFVVAGRGVVHIPSLMFGSLNNPHGNFPSQAKQVIQQQGFQAFDPVENPNPSNANNKQQVHVAHEGCTDEDVNAVGDPSDKNLEANRWPREETLALLRIRADMDANLKDSNVKGPVWETVSRKLAELGFYRSAKKCKEKFENVNKYYKKTKDGRINRQDGKAYRFCSELEALHSAISAKHSGIDNHINGIASDENIIYNKNNPSNSTSVQIEEITRQAPKTTLQSSSENGYNSRQNMSSDSTSVEELGEPNSDEHVNMKKRKRKQKMGTIKTFLENMVQQVLEHQETFQQKLLEAIEKRDDERLKREESWKRQEMARLNRQTEQRAQEHAIQSSREKALISFLNKFTGENFKLDPQVIMTKSTAPNDQEEEKCTDVRESNDPRCKRWPKSEVYALIQLRSEMEQRFKESGPKVTLWEEISSAMAIMGFNRSAKRCKEKWENINKYFRKTKGSFKKRPLNTKTCPYFHQLDTLYRKGLLLSPGHAKFENNLPNHNSNSGTLANQDDHQIKSNEVQISNQDSELLAMIPSTNQASIPTSESMELQAQKKMKWNNNFIDTMENQAASLKSRSVDEFSLIKNTHSRRFNMDSLDKDNLKRPQAQQHHIFFNGFDRREKEGGLIDLEGNHEQQKIQINQVFHPTEEQQHSHANVSQSALMALVHKLSASYTT